MRRVEEGNTNVEGNMFNCWGSFTKGILCTADKICGRTKAPARHVETWWGNDTALTADRAIKKKCKLWYTGTEKGW